MQGSRLQCQGGRCHLTVLCWGWIFSTPSRRLNSPATASERWHCREHCGSESSVGLSHTPWGGHHWGLSWLHKGAGELGWRGTKGCPAKCRVALMNSQEGNERPRFRMGGPSPLLSMLLAKDVSLRGPARREDCSMPGYQGGLAVRGLISRTLERCSSFWTLISSMLSASPGKG